MTLLKSTLSQTDLVKGCIRNDRRAQEALYRQYAQAMLALCNSYTKNQQDATEVLQDGFLKIFQQMERFDESKASLYTWMRTIVLRSAIDFLRKQEKQFAVVEWKEAHETSIDAAVLQKMSGENILYLLRQLPETTRAVFNLHISEGYSHKEIGALLVMSEGTSRWHLSEARKFLIGSLKSKEIA